MAYGYTIESQKPNVLAETIDRMTAEFSLAAVPMGWAIDIVPALQIFRTASQVPGSRRPLENGANLSKYRLSSGVTFVCLSKLVESLRQDGNGELSVEDEESAIWTAANLYGAAADTTVVNLIAFTLAVIKFPEGQCRAQEEIDRVVGTDLLPSFPDHENLPYVAAMVKEATCRWPISPMGFP
jgi:hypothetical protein